MPFGIDNFKIQAMVYVFIKVNIEISKGQPNVIISRSKVLQSLIWLVMSTCYIH